MATNYNIDTFRQETLQLAIDVNLEATPENPMPMPIDISGSTFYFTVKKSQDMLKHNRNAVLKKKWTNQDVPEQVSELQPGQTILNVPSEEMDIPTGVYKYDIRMEDQYGKVDTICYGKFIVRQNTTEL
jgi:ribosomal protein L24E